jgi:phosphoribosylanthranilate isomerase
MRGCDRDLAMKVEVKICGITNRDDALYSLDCNADYIGFVLYSKSPRSITASSLSALLGKLGRPCRAIGVFVNEKRANVESIASDCGLYAVQIHGDESADEFSGFPCRVWRAVKQVSGVWKPSPPAWTADRYVVDSSVGGMYGGTGVAADWNVCAGFMKQYPAILSGGLTPENVADAILTARPLGVDAASGVESSAGRKDRKKIEMFIRNAKAAEL